MRTLALITFLFMMNTLSAQNNLGIFQASQDIGELKLRGNSIYKADQQSYTLEGSGSNIWFDNDEFHYLYRKMEGNLVLRARVDFIGEGVNPHRKAGWMVRSSQDSDASHASAVVHGDGLTSFQYRKSTGTNTEEQKSTLNAPDVIQLERSGKTFTMSAAKFGEPFTVVHTMELNLEDKVYVGLFICAHDNTVKESATFSNVRIIKPAPENLTSYQEYIGSNLETMEITTGHRRILHRVDHSIQAPNWTVDGKKLIYNSNGLLYNFHIKSQKPEILNTGFADNNNNDHVLSFDGKLLGISHHSKDDDGQSIIFYLPAKGGQPKRVTSQGPSYLHGWSPDAEFMTYTGARNGQYDIYKINKNGGKEIQLTNQKTLDDGSEYSPDGEYIYFNSSRTGTMQIWRMKPDGKEQEQLTFDEYNDWFPHISPDGKFLIMLSYMPEVPAGDHPFYKHVYLRKMPVAGGDPTVIAYIYGGQGTINVPSFSPDGKRIAFVSNTIQLESVTK